VRIDDYLSAVGIIKRRTVAKEMGTAGLLEINGRRVKPAHEINPGDIIRIKGSRPMVVEVLAVPVSSVPKTERGTFFKVLPPH
jgi:ribosomal 50S subunit-recycling heat shock protein